MKTLARLALVATLSACSPQARTDAVSTGWSVYRTVRAVCARVLQLPDAPAPSSPPSSGGGQ